MNSELSKSANSATARDDGGEVRRDPSRIVNERSDEAFEHYEVPRRDRTALVSPPIDVLEGVLRSPFGLDGTAGIEFCGKSLDITRQQARQEVYDLACNYTSRYRDLDSCGAGLVLSAEMPLIMSGHQPELFHPGVWFKNFLLSKLASDTRGVAINFLVDNDVCRNASIRVPSRNPAGKLVAQSVPFDHPRESVPWELRTLASIDCWESFPGRVAAAMLPTEQSPLLHQLWPLAIEAVKSSGNLGASIAQARHLIEAQIGLQTLEVPLSQLVGTRAFARFSIQLLSELPRLQDIYNTELLRYREAHHIRSSAHPVPMLEFKDGWLEAPWWVYKAESPVRKKLWVRLQDDQLQLSDRGGWEATIGGRLDCDNAATQWLELLSDGVCLRPRALLTTMYLRLIVGDMFLHGIGGGKYDQLTNAIMRRFFDISPPPMAVATATLHLPLKQNEVDAGSSLDTESKMQAERERQWELKFHAEKHLLLDDQDEASRAEIESLSERKSTLLESIPPAGEKWQWHREITAINQRLAELAADKLQASKHIVDELADSQRQQRVLESREHSFCLYPLQYLNENLSQLVSQ